MTEEQNVLIMTFPDPGGAVQAFEQIKHHHGLVEAAVVERTADGGIRIAHSHSPVLGSRLAAGGLIGGVIGILGGPLGILLGWATGMVAGYALESTDATDADDTFAMLSRTIPPGGNELIVELRETDPAEADELARRLGGTVARIPAAEVEAEIAASQKALVSAGAEARRVRRESPRNGLHARIEAILHHRAQAG